MPGIIVDRRDDDLLEVKFPYFEPYIKRIRDIDGARYSGDEEKVWTVPIESAQDLDDEFYGELIYVVPRHEILGIDPPKPSKIFKKVPRTKIAGLNQKPYEFQLFGANFLAWRLQEKKVAILGDLMGTGKTFQSIMTALQMKQANLVKKVLVVVLASTRSQWGEEIEKFCNEPYCIFSDFKTKYRTVNRKKIVSESIDDQKKAFIADFKNSDKMFMVMSYQGLQQNHKMLENLFDMVIFDEAHTINNKGSKTNKAATTLIQKRSKKNRRGFNKGIGFTLLVSGTPITSYPDQLFGLLRIANPDILGNWKQFRDEFLIFNKYRDIVGYRNLDKLRRLVQNIFIRRTDRELDISLPSIIERDVYIDPHPKQIKFDKELIAYQKELIDNKMNLLRAGKKKEAQALEDKLKGILAQRRAASNHPNQYRMSDRDSLKEKYSAFYTKSDLDIPKFDRCLTLIEEIVNSGHKVVVFTESRRITAMLHKHIKKFTRALRYVGGLDDKTRKRRRQKFNNDPRCRVIIANKAGSTGLNLQAGRYLINYDLPDTPAEWEQRKYRIRRLDSKHDKVYIINLINKGMVDEQIMAKLKNKQAAFDFVIENDSGQTQAHQKITGKKKEKSKKKSKRNEDDLLW